ncbi:MAG: hypothetical protein HYX75_08525 [Acidobacteria bacterium]|nr:hypothetical protein [Acidobacteriota bacterium]
MAKPGRATQGKRIRERAKLEKRQHKLERRAERKAEKENKPRAEGGVDPDLAGIVPGPQPLPDID